MASSAVKIVLNAVDKYTPAIVGLNQGLELLGKGYDFLKGAAETAYSVIESGINLAIVGGQFEEINTQFGNLAASMGVNAKQIVKEVRAVSQQTITDYEAVGIASKALAARMTGTDLKTILDFTKRYTESTGESFTAMSERIFTAIASGRTSTLKQMGLIIKNGATMADVVAAAAKQTKLFGDAGFNAADKVDALAAAQDDFTRKLGQSINNSPRFRKILGGLAQDVRDFVDAFDPDFFVGFVDLGIEGISKLYTFVVKNGQKVIEWLIGTKIPVIETTEDIAGLVQDMITNIVSTVGTGINSILDFLQNLNSNNIIGKVIDNAVQLFAWGADSALKITRFAVSGILKVIDGVLLAIENGLVAFRKFEPALAKLGINLDVNSALSGVRSAGDQISAMAENVAGMGSDIQEGLEAISGASESVFANINDSIETLKIDTDAAVKAVTVFEKGTTKFVEARKSLANSTAFDTDKFLKDSNDMVEKTKKTTKELSNEAKELAKREANALSIVQDEYDRLKKKLALGTDLTGRKLSFFAEADIERQLAELQKKLTVGLKTTGQIEIEYKTKNEAIEEIIKRWGGTNWPQAWLNMARSFMEMLVARAAGEEIPLTITNYSPL